MNFLKSFFVFIIIFFNFTEKLEDARKELAELNRENQEVVQSQAS